MATIEIDSDELLDWADKIIDTALTLEEEATSLTSLAKNIIDAASTGMATGSGAAEDDITEYHVEAEKEFLKWTYTLSIFAMYDRMIWIPDLAEVGYYDSLEESGGIATHTPVWTEEMLRYAFLLWPPEVDSIGIVLEEVEGHVEVPLELDRCRAGNWIWEGLAPWYMFGSHLDPIAFPTDLIIERGVTEYANQAICQYTFDEIYDSEVVPGVDPTWTGMGPPPDPGGGHIYITAGMALADAVSLAVDRVYAEGLIEGVIIPGGPILGAFSYEGLAGSDPHGILKLLE